MSGEVSPGVQAKYETLETIFVGPVGTRSATLEDTGRDGLGEGRDSAVCLAYRREEELQYKFLVLFQAVIAILSLGTLLLLLFALWQVANGLAVGTILSAAGAVVTGVAAKFLLGQRKDARDAYRAAKLGLARHKCLA